MMPVLATVSLSYDAEKRAALEKWARRLQEIAEGKRAEKVVSIGGRNTSA